jgi:hypothetical protein
LQVFSPKSFTTLLLNEKIQTAFYSVKVKVKFTLEQAMKAQTGLEV